MIGFNDFAKEMQKKFEKINNIILEEMEEKATMCVAETMSRTPTKTGNLKRSMTHKKIEKVGRVYSVRIGSALPYAQAVNDGHKQVPGTYVAAIGKKLVKSFVQGKHMIDDSVEIYQRELEKSIPERIRNEVK